MLKIVVFDDGWGGELVADFLMQELKIAEVIRVIDWARSPYSNRSCAEIYNLIIGHLEPYIGTVDAIVLGGYTVSLAINELRAKFPNQVFVGMGINYDLILRSRNSLENVVILAESLVGKSALQLELRRKLPYSTLIFPDCDGWQEKIDAGAMTKEWLEMDLMTDFCTKPRGLRSLKKPNKDKTLKGQQIKKISHAKVSNDSLKMAIKKLGLVAEKVKANEKAELELRLDSYNGVNTSNENLANDERIKPDVVLLLNTHFWDVKKDIEEILGWDVRVMDFRDKLLRDICRAVRLRGVDGKRSK